MSSVFGVYETVTNDIANYVVSTQWDNEFVSVSNVCNICVFVLRYVWGLRSTAIFVLHSAESNRVASSNGFVTSQILSPRAFGSLAIVSELDPKSFINPLKTKHRPLNLKTQSVPRCKHF
jgi:hypothetical protein